LKRSTLPLTPLHHYALHVYLVMLNVSSTVDNNIAITLINRYLRIQHYCGSREKWKYTLENTEMQ